MKQLSIVFCGLFLAQPVLAQPAAEKAEKRLTELLSPGSGGAAAPFADKAVAWPGSKGLDVFVLPIRPYVGMPARLPLPASANVKPRSAPEATPLVAFREPPKAPKEIELPTAPLLRLPPIDVAAPVPIPILGQPVKDRASLAEPAFEASLAAALKPFTPVRDKPQPFVPLNLPDPFENLRYGQLRHPPDEIAMPPAIPLQKPTK